MINWGAGETGNFSLTTTYDHDTHYYHAKFIVEYAMADRIKRNYIKTYKKQYNRKGFRPGKLTRRQIEKMMGGPRAVYSIAFGTYATEKIIEHCPHKVIHITNQDASYEPDGSWILKCDVFVEHPIENVDELLNMEFQLPRLDPEEYVNYRVETFRKLNPYLHRKDGVVEDGDMVEVGIQSFIDGKVFTQGCEEATNVRMIEGAVKPPSLYDSLLGLKAGDEFTIETGDVSSLSQRFGINADGSKFTLKVKINHVYTCEEPDIDDDLAISAGYDTVDHWYTTLSDAARRINDGRDHQLKRKLIIEHLENNSGHPEFPLEWGVEKASEIAKGQQTSFQMEYIDRLRKVAREITLLRLIGMYLDIEYDDAKKDVYQRDDNAYAEKVLQHLIGEKVKFVYVNANDYEMGGGDTTDVQSDEGSAASVGA